MKIKMLEKLASILLIGLMINVAVFAGESVKEKEFTEKVKSEITKLGVGTDVKVKIKLKDGTKLKGYISEIKADGFTLTNEKTGAASEVLYSQPKQIKGNNLSNSIKVALGVGLIAGLIAVFIIAGRS